jgi:hypothetical protein
LGRLPADDRGLPTSAMMTALHHVAPVLAAATDVTRRLSLLLGDLGPDASTPTAGKGFSTGTSATPDCR